MRLVAGCILLPNNFFIVVLHIGELCKEVQMIVLGGCTMAKRTGWVEMP
jgi:hypothetical protein